MNVDTINTALLHGEVDRKGVFPHLDTLEFAWFGRTFPKGHLTVVSASRFEAERMTGVTMEDFLEQK